VNSDASPTARALLTLELIQGSPGITADRIADKLAVSERAARRYVAILREADVPIESVRGPYGGYHVGRGIRLPPLMFTAAEALGLVMAVLDGHHDASDPVGPVGSALGKIIRALPEPIAAQAEVVRRTTSPAPDRGAVRPDPATTSALVQACSAHRLARLGYRSEAGSEWITDVEPWAVVVRHGRWYLLCQTRGADARRAYRIDRVQHVDVLDETFSPPPELDPVAALEEQLATGWEFEAEIIFDAPADAVARHLPRPLGRLELIDNTTSRLTGSTSNPVWYAEQLAAIPVAYRITRGKEVQEAARAVGQRLLAAVAPAQHRAVRPGPAGGRARPH
jgi:predicted DNA-binding transcriptional regulator YafY